MTVLGTATERPNSPRISGTINQRKYTREWLVQTNDYKDGPAIVASSAGIPFLYSSYNFGNEIDVYALLRELEAERANPNSLFWYVTGHYSTPEPYRRHMPSGGLRDTAGANDNPLLQLPEIDTSFEKYQEVVFYVYDQLTQQITPCRASNNEVYNPPPTKDASRLILTITRNEEITAPHPAADLIYNDSVNADIFWGSPPGTWKCQGISARRETKQLQDKSILPYLKVTYKFEARLTWDTQILDAGTYYLPGGNRNQLAKKMAFLTSDGHPITGTLNGAGDSLLPPQNPDASPGASPVFNTFRFYQRQPFGLLSLPQSFADVA